MLKPIRQKESNVVQEEEKTFSESNDFNHERNSVSTAQKQMATQETAGVLDYGTNLITDSYERFMVENPLDQVEEKTKQLDQD